MKHCPLFSDNGGPCPNAYLAVCPELGKPGKCREVGLAEVIEAIAGVIGPVIAESKKTKKKSDDPKPQP